MLLILLMLLLLLDAVTSFRLTIDYNMSNCYNFSPTNYDTYPLNSSYETNLNHTLTTLVSNISTANHTFLTYKQGSENQDPAYGVALCRGDINPADCHVCVQLASEQVIRECPRARQAIMWKEQCMLRYSNHSLSDHLQEQPSQLMYNDNNITQHIDDWTKLLQDTLTEVTSIAATGRSGNKYATKEKWFSPLNTFLFTLAQCTPDLNTKNCSECFRAAKDQMYDNLRQGGIMLTPSCTIRYELYPFYLISSSTVQSAPPPTDITKKDRGKKASKRTKVAVVITVPLGVVGMLFAGICLLISMKTKKNRSIDIKNLLGDLTAAESLMFELETLEAATNNFSDNQILGQGGFGSVYKGTLPNGQEIAVKRLSKISSQGVEEFKNEVVLIANLQHRNLVRLLGFCLAGEEKLLVYEFVPNKSLNYFLFDTQKQGELSWSKRYDIIKGIARGLLYLHEDSRPRIIHRDLKSGNILLDENLNPKIADFGLARIFKVEQTVDDTSRVVGTYGYMAPEYAMHGQFSVKSDVYSFGVLVLEIVSGKKISTRFNPTGGGDLLTYAWRSFTEEKPLEFMDPSLNESNSSAEVLRCIQLGLWCAQETTNERPTMSTIVQTLNTESTTNTMPIPQSPRFFYNSSTESSLISKLSPRSTTTTSSTSESKPHSENQVTISEMYPR